MLTGLLNKTTYEEINTYIDFLNEVPSGDTITLVSVTATDPDGTVATDTVIVSAPPGPAPFVTGTRVNFRVKGGTKIFYYVSVKVSVSDGQKLEAIIELRIGGNNP